MVHVKVSVFVSKWHNECRVIHICIGVEGKVFVELKLLFKVLDVGFASNVIEVRVLSRFV